MSPHIIALKKIRENIYAIIWLLTTYFRIFLLLIINSFFRDKHAKFATGSFMPVFSVKKKFLLIPKPCSITVSSYTMSHGYDDILI